MPKSIAVIGAPSSAGAYAPGQEKAPAALRAAGLIDRLEKDGHVCVDLGDVEGFRWYADRESPRAMHHAEIVRVARDVSDLVERAKANGHLALVLGGDCTVELGTLAGVLKSTDDVGLIYFDLDADMNTPGTTTDGALDWMGVAHMLELPDTVQNVTSLASRRPMLAPDSLMLFGVKNIKPHEADWIEKLQITMIKRDAVAENPAASAQEAVAWASRFGTVLVHFDVDVVDFENFPIAENVRRKEGLSLHQTMLALRGLLSAPNLGGLTVCEVNPDHGLEDGSTMEAFVTHLTKALADGNSPSFHEA